MSRTITFSRTFPAYHPKAGQPTFFVEGILTQLGINRTTHDYLLWLKINNPEISELFLSDFYDSLSENIEQKSHTIRAHKNPLKVGEFINPKCWADKPYNKTKEGFWQIKFAPDIQIKKTWNFSKDILSGEFYLDGFDATTHLEMIAKNDGLSLQDFKDWFNKPVANAQINCWNENIKY